MIRKINNLFREWGNKWEHVLVATKKGALIGHMLLVLGWCLPPGKPVSNQSSIRTWGSSQRP